MRKPLRLNGSIYGQELTVKNGRLINNRPDGQTGIAQAAQIRKSMKRAEKISMISEGVRLGDFMSEMSEGCD